MAGLLGNVGRLFWGDSASAPQIARNLPPYVEFDGDWCRRHPGTLGQVTTRLFPVSADSSVLRDLCNNLINNHVPSRRPAPVEVEPLLNGIIVAVVEYRRAFSIPDSNWGYLVYKEGGVFVPVRLLINGNPDGFAGIVPYLFVDRFSPIVTGRESFGFPKRLADMDFKTTSWRICADVVPREPNPDAIGSGVVLNICSSGDFHEVPISFPDPELPLRLRSIAERIVHALGPSNVTLASFDEVALVVLKQFRDAVSPNCACHRSVVRADFKVTAFPSAWELTGGFNVDVSANFQPNMARNLGFATARANVGIRMDMNFDLVDGKTLWS
jgi:hypothetical protein